jgi:hypothetical protein
MLQGWLREHHMTDEQEEIAFARAVSWIHREFGRLDDLPKPVIPVIWVTVYRGMETGLEAESKGGALGLVKDALRSGDLLLRVQESTLAIEFLQKMIPMIRASRSKRDQLGDSQLLIDMLKWGVLDAPDMSLWQRFRARLSAKADPMYQQPVPLAILSGSA